MTRSGTVVNVLLDQADPQLLEQALAPLRSEAGARIQIFQMGLEEIFVELVSPLDINANT